MQIQKQYFYAWAALDKLTYRRYLKIKNYFGDLHTAWEQANLNTLQKAGLENKISEEIIDLRNKINPREELEKNQKLGIQILMIEDQDYPILLKEIASPPVFLFLKGQLSPDDLCLAVVGARKITNYGKQVVYNLISEIARKGLTIISGLALGTDTLAHQETLKAGGRTIAVLGNGLDQIYPIQNKSLAEKIEENGVIISEFPLGVPPHNYNFPRRNRIISGLSLGTLVIEAAKKSGSLITARNAIEQNRDVFAVPGSVFSHQSGGTNHLIQKGEAKLVMQAQDILEELNLNLVRSQVAIKKIPQVQNLNKIESLVLEIISSESLLFDLILKQVDLDAATLTSTLTFLELKGFVRTFGNNTWGRLV